MSNWLTHEEAGNFCSECDHIQLVEGDVEERHETVKAFEEHSFYNQWGFPPMHRPAQEEVVGCG